MFCLDLDQLNHILGVVGSPTPEDLQCIINEKVCVQCVLVCLYDVSYIVCGTECLLDVSYIHVYVVHIVSSMCPILCVVQCVLDVWCWSVS